MKPNSQQAYDVNDRIWQVQTAEGALILTLQEGWASVAHAQEIFDKKLRDLDQDFSDRYIADARQHALSVLASHRAV